LGGMGKINALWAKKFGFVVFLDLPTAAEAMAFRFGDYQK
jgi:hypothetical protein